MSTITCKAAVLHEVGKPMEIEEVTLDSPGAGEARIRIAATGICGSDIHSLRGEHGETKTPGVGGHEVAGYIDELGEGVIGFNIGDPVLVSLEPAGCGQCYYCVRGYPNMCEKKWKVRPPAHFKGLTLPGRYVNKNGVRLYQYGGTTSGFAEYTIAMEKRLIKFPADMPMESASLLACGVITGFCSVTNAAQVQPLSSVVVMGVGGVGINSIQGAALSGAYPVIAVDVVDSKLETARKFGATHTINSRTEQDPVMKAYEMTSGRGADYVFVTVGGKVPLRQGFSMSGFRGMTVIIGHSGDDNLSDFEPTDFIGGQRILTGSGAGSARVMVDIPRIISLYQAGRYKLDEMVSGRYPLEKINEAIEAVDKGNVIRNVIVFK
ncbi:MAG: alcohol dehydrogenase catalytic domain-containing protein [Dehalococcoidales bacterium]|nr:alcohol dehydrogenase catalytic domain-containing protein [Dehalococcoidales bacterium]